MLWRLVALGVVLALVRSAAAPGAAGHDAYIWQRRWTPGLAAAIRDNADLFGVWHVLAAEVSASGRVIRTQADWAALGSQVMPVVRIEGGIEPDGVAGVVSDIVAVVADLPASARGRLEVDHDAATSHLGVYARFLQELRQALPRGILLSITVLPTWLGSPAFDAVAGAADLLVLQVHSIDDPRVGLFDARRAAGWVAALDRRTRRPFQVALPAYGARVVPGAGGSLLAVSAEMHALDGEAGTEIAASPVAVAAFLDGLRLGAPDRFRGVVWFRLPTGDDRRAWSASTLRAVVLGGMVRPRIEVVARPGWTDGLSDIVVVNQGDVDGRLPLAVRLPVGCAAADGVGSYELDGARLKLRGEGSGLLAAHAAVAVGWMRCGGGDEGLHAEE